MTSTARFNGALDFAILGFIISGGLYFLFYSLQSNKVGYLLVGVLIYIISYYIRRSLRKDKHKAGLTEAGTFFVSMTFMAYTLHIFKLDPNVGMYLPDKLLVNSGACFILVLVMNLLPKNKLGNFSVLPILVLLAVIFSRGYLDSIFRTYPWVSSLTIGTPYIYLLSLLTGVYAVR